MLTKIDLYVLRLIWGGLWRAALVLVSLGALFSVVGELGAISRGVHNLWLEVMEITPFIIYDMFLFACLIGTALAVQSMIANNEMTFIREVGLSSLRLASLIMLSAALFGLVALLWLELVAVPLHAYVHAQRAGLPVITPQQDLWLEDDGQIIYIESLPAAQETNGDGSLVGFGYSSQDLTAYYKGENFSWTAAGESQISKLATWGESTSLANLEAEITSFSTRDWSQSAALPPERAQNLPQLAAGIRANQAAGMPLDGFRIYGFWDRLSKPLFFVALALAALALGLVSGPRASMGVRIIIVAAAGIFITSLCRSIAIYTAIADASYVWLSMFAPAALIAVAALALIRQHF